MAKESVWDYPRPPRMELSPKRVRVEFAGIVIADSTRAYRILETSHPPVYYLPPEDISMKYLKAVPSYSTFCEWKGAATYWTIEVSGKRSEQVAWSYAAPAAPYQALKNHLAFYASRVDGCYVDDEKVMAQAGDFYGGWITADIVGPFKGGKGTAGW